MKGKKVWIWEYELVSATALNRVSTRTRHPGALLRLENGGVGCLHPWPELGDAPLPDQLRILREGGTSRLLSRSLECAERDGRARNEGRSLFPEGPLPPSHWLFLEGDDPAGIPAAGFEAVKMKIGRDLEREAERTGELVAAGLRVRLDANESLEFEVFRDWWKALSGAVRERIEFVEDPIPWDRGQWENLARAGVPLAADREAENRLEPCRWAVWKPAVSGKERLLEWAREEKRRIAVTSHMDHPVGQMWAARCARELTAAAPGITGDAGLLTHRCFQPTDFSGRILTDGPRLLPPEGTGLGFDDLIEKLTWKRLI